MCVFKEFKGRSSKNSLVFREKDKRMKEKWDLNHSVGGRQGGTGCIDSKAYAFFRIINNQRFS